jgi:hypothetical protein
MVLWHSSISVSDAQDTSMLETICSGSSPAPPPPHHHHHPHTLTQTQSGRGCVGPHWCHLVWFLQSVS